MKILFSVFIALLLAQLTGCATTPTATTSELKEIFLQANVTVLPVENPVRLQERTKAQAVGNMILSSVVSSVAGSGGSANPQQFQNNMQITQNFGQQLNQALPASAKVEAGVGADLALAKKISDFFNQKSQFKNDKGRNIVITVASPLWELGYVSLLTSSDYVLNYKLQVQIAEKQNNATKPLKTVSCAASSKESMPLEQWQADNYAAVNPVAEKLVAECFAQFTQETGIMQ